jgi:hypothetical protein
VLGVVSFVAHYYLGTAAKQAHGQKEGQDQPGREDVRQLERVTRDLSRPKGASHGQRTSAEAILKVSRFPQMAYLPGNQVLNALKNVRDTTNEVLHFS